MRCEVKLFARARDVVGAETVEVELAEDAGTPTVGDLKQALSRDFPTLSPLAANLLVAVGAEYATDATALRDDLEIACFPPVSGG